MKANGAPHLLPGLAMCFVLLVNGEFTTWVDTTGGRYHLDWILFRYLGNCHSKIGIFCTDFNNANVYSTGHPASKLDCSALTKVAIAFKAVNTLLIS
jgi:hypothetical protein